MRPQDYFLNEDVYVPSFQAPGVVLGIAGPEGPPDGTDRFGCRYLVKMHLPPKLRWLTAEEIEPSKDEDDEGFEFGIRIVAANSP